MSEKEKRYDYIMSLIERIDELGEGMVIAMISIFLTMSIEENTNE
jgi:hypothetical protein